MDLIATTGELAEVCARMAQHPYVTVDTEFLRETTYYPLLCVAQMASPDEAVVIDALAPGIDLAPFFDADGEREGDQGVPRRAPGHRNRLAPGQAHPASDLRHPGRRHGARLWRLRSPTTSWCSASPATSSTSRTASPTGRGGRCRTRRSAYALSDVTHLRDVYLTLVADLAKRGRTDWVEEEMGVLTSPDTYRMDPDSAWERLKSRVRKPKELAVLIEIAAWREREAQTRDVPRARVLKDDVVGDIAVQAPTTVERLAAFALAAERFRAFALGRGHYRGGRRAGSRAIPRRCRGSSGSAPAPNGAATVELLKVLLRMTSERHGVAAKVIATVDELDRIAADDRRRRPCAEQAGGANCSATRRSPSNTGKLALAVDKGRVVTVEKS